MERSRLVGLISLNANYKQVDEKSYNFHDLGFNYHSLCKGEKHFLFELTTKPKYLKNVQKEIIVLLDGMIDNFNELKLELSLKANDQKELIVELYKLYPESFEKFLLGNFAIALFDESLKKIILVRDHFGTKPLYFNLKDKRIIFSSEIKFLLRIDSSLVAPNLEKVLNFLCQSKPEYRQTFFKDILSLPPSSKLIFSKDVFLIDEYQHYKDYSFKGKSFKEAKIEFKYLLEKACGSKIKKTANNAVQISGGLDSAVINSILQNSDLSNLETYSWNFSNNEDDPLACDETYFQELIVSNKKKHKQIQIGQSSPYINVEKYLDRYDQPFELANVYLYEKLYETAHSKKIDYIYDGVDGDLVVSHGWERFKELFNVVNFPRFIYELNMFSKKHDYSEYSKSSLFKMFLRPLVKENFFLNQLLKIKNILKKKNINKDQQRKLIVKREFLKKINLHEPYDFKRNYQAHNEKIKNKFLECAFINIDILFFKFDILQVSPFFDKRFVDFCVSLPSKMKLNHGESRYILRESFKHSIPKEVYKRFSKSNLTENFINNISDNDFVKIKYEIENIHPLISPYIDKEFLNHEYGQLLQRSLKESTSMNIWNFYLVNKWLKHNFSA